MHYAFHHHVLASYVGSLQPLFELYVYTTFKYKLNTNNTYFFCRPQSSPITDLYPLGVVDETSEDDDAEDEEEDQQHQLLG